MNQHDPQPDGVTPATPSASPADGYPGSRPVVVALVVTALFVLTQLYASIPLLGPLATTFGADATFALSTAFSVTYAVGFLIWGPSRIDTGGRRSWPLPSEFSPWQLWPVHTRLHWRHSRGCERSRACPLRGSRPSH